LEWFDGSFEVTF